MHYIFLVLLFKLTMVVFPFCANCGLCLHYKILYARIGFLFSVQSIQPHLFYAFKNVVLYLHCLVDSIFINTWLTSCYQWSSLPPLPKRKHFWVPYGHRVSFVDYCLGSPYYLCTTTTWQDHQAEHFLLWDYLFVYYYSRPASPEL